MPFPVPDHETKREPGAAYLRTRRTTSHQVDVLPIRREDIRSGYWAGLNFGKDEDEVVTDWRRQALLSLWPEVAQWVEHETGSTWPTATRAHREPLLDAYLDRVLTVV